MARLKVLICDSDTADVEVLWHELRGAGYDPLAAFSIERAKALIDAECPGAIFVRARMPDGSGLSLIHDLRNLSATVRTPVIAIGERDSTETESIRFLESGADDYVRKPYGLSELLARLKALLRHAPRIQAPARVSFETLTMDFDARRALVCTDDGIDGHELDLVPTGFLLLRLLIENPFIVISRRSIIETVWFGADVKTGTIDVHMAKVRQALKVVQQRVVIETVRGRGFRLTTPEKVREALLDDSVPQPSCEHEQRTIQTKPAAQQAYDEPVLVSDLGAAIETIRRLRRMLARTREENQVLRNSTTSSSTPKTDSGPSRKNRKKAGG
jgi:two-component system phosphate regulon response regulator PhoB